MYAAKDLNSCEKEQQLSRNVTKPGERVSLGQYRVPTSGRLLSSAGKGKVERRALVELFIDHASRHIFVRRQSSLHSVVTFV